MDTYEIGIRILCWCMHVSFFNATAHLLHASSARAYRLPNSVDHVGRSPHPESINVVHTPR